MSDWVRSLAFLTTNKRSEKFAKKLGIPVFETFSHYGVTGLDAELALNTHPLLLGCKDALNHPNYLNAVTMRRAWLLIALLRL